MSQEHLRILSEVTAWALGPVTGKPHEILEPEPQPASIFITGMIKAPGTEMEDIQTEDYYDESYPEQEEDSETMDTIPFLTVNPVLHPDRLPASLGITFAMRCSDEKIKLSVCVTWARYLRIEPRWKRFPFCEIKEISCSKDEVQDDGFSETYSLKDHLSENPEAPEGTEDTEMSLVVKIRKKMEDLFNVSVFLVARKPLGSGKQRNTEHIIFQPQIRIVLGNGCHLARGQDVDRRPADSFDRQFLEANLEIPLRGHLCSAVWKEIDPQQTNLRELPEGVVYPFHWVDGAVVRESYGNEEYLRFLRCDVRTEYIPVVEVPSPDLDPEDIPSFDAEKLAETWDPEKIREIIQPLIDRYSEWIERTFGVEESQSADSSSSVARKKHLLALKRMKESLTLIWSDSTVRLAFCFANKAISLQYRWKIRNRSAVFRWRPFQLGFFLLVMESLCNPESPGRKMCDLLWIPTGGGKTEAYLGIVAFLLALRRLKHGDRGLGTAVISRYTLRLLGIQQFTRILSLVTACEYLRTLPVFGGKHGWRPADCRINRDWLWGKEWFSAGLWVGGNITPNKLRGIPGRFLGARDILESLERRPERNYGNVTPLQVTVCPACGTLLALVDDEDGIPWREGTLWFVIRIRNFRNPHITGKNILPVLSGLPRRKYSDNNEGVGAVLKKIVPVVLSAGIYSAGLDVVTEKGRLRRTGLKHLWENFWRDFTDCLREKGLHADYLSFSCFTPGYFAWGRDDFRIICPSPECPLRENHDESWQYVREYSGVDIVSRTGTDDDVKIFLKHSVHIPALVVDEQIYRELPSVVVATVDKFARLPSEPKCAALFGNVDHFSRHYLFYREAAEEVRHRDSTVLQDGLLPPELIIQDELHLLEGPLGSLAGLYETAVEFLCREKTGVPPKYIASTATIRKGEHHVRALFARNVFIFPPPVQKYGNNFFTVTETERTGILFGDCNRRGRIYAGIAPFGWGPLTPQVVIAASLYRAIRSIKNTSLLTYYRIPVFYYNAIRELAAGLHLFYQDIQEWLRGTGDQKLAEQIHGEKVVELSGRISSGALPFILKLLEMAGTADEPPQALLTTSIFGTGVDIPYLSLMVVNGQPKTTSAYIQSTGRIGREKTGLVFTVYRISRPRDLSHYEHFASYHRAMYRYVEESTVFPFSVRCLERGSGPVAVALLRLSSESGRIFARGDSAICFADYQHRNSNVTRFVEKVIRIFKDRNREQPEILRIPDSEFEGILRGRENGFDRWREVAVRCRLGRESLVYVEYFEVMYNVVLGDMQHERAGRFCVYRRVPSSLRTVEEEVEVRFSGR